MRLLRLWTLTCWLIGVALSSPGSLHAQDTRPDVLLKAYADAAGAPGVPARGQAFFMARHGQSWRCASCHQANPVQPGRHASTGQTILPLAPAANTARFTKQAKVEKWFKRNCQDVLKRACSDQEKADVLAWLITLQP